MIPKYFSVLNDNQDYVGINDNILIGNKYSITDLKSDGTISIKVEVDLLGIFGNEGTNFQYSVDLDITSETIIKELK